MEDILEFIGEIFSDILEEIGRSVRKNKKLRRWKKALLLIFLFLLLIGAILLIGFVSEIF